MILYNREMSNMNKHVFLYNLYLQLLQDKKYTMRKFYQYLQLRWMNQKIKLNFFLRYKIMNKY